MLYGNEQRLEDILGRPLDKTISDVVSMLLYLCVEEPDISARPLPVSWRATAGRSATRQVSVVDAGWRLGTALQADRVRYATRSYEPTGKHLAPHLRRAHWHSYWTGPRGNRDPNSLVLRFLAPIQVGSEPVNVTVVRDAGGMGEEDVQRGKNSHDE